MIPLISELYPQRMALDASAGLVVVAVHGYCLALFAKLLGDQGPTYDGRLTADPMAHINIFSLLSIVLANVVWVKPMDIRASSFKLGNFGVGATVGATLLVVYLLGATVHASRPLILAYTPPDLLQSTLAWFNTLARIFERTALINLIPLLSLSGGYIIRPYLPGFIRTYDHWMPALTLLLVSAIEIWVW